MGAIGHLCRRLTLLMAIAIGAVGVCVSSAHASSIFFIRSNNIWVANPNGSDARQVTTDGGNGQPYVWVSAAKTANRLAYQRDDNASNANPRQIFGTMNTDGSGSAVNPDNANLQSHATDGAMGTMVSIDTAGDRIAVPETYSTCVPYPYCDVTGTAAYSVGVDGTGELHDAVAGALAVTFGDPAGQTLLFQNIDPGNSIQPQSCISNTSTYFLTRQAPTSDGTGGPATFYCVNGSNLIEPALRPDGQLIAAVQASDLSGNTNSIVTIPIGGAASNAAASPVTQLTAPGSADHPDFSPDGAQIAFESAGNTIDVISASGGTATQILTNASSPAWSPYTLPGGSGSGGGGTGGGGGSAHCTVPKLKGDTVKQARTALRNHGCTLGKRRKAFSKHIKRGHVISQSPAAGTTKPSGAAVNIKVSKGKK